jgi:hypothetical protein
MDWNMNTGLWISISVVSDLKVLCVFQKLELRTYKMHKCGELGVMNVNNLGRTLEEHDENMISYKP